MLISISRCLLILTIALYAMTVSAEDTLRYEINGVRGAVRENVRAWLGARPQSEAERTNFLASAQERIAQSLRALGYYRPQVRLDLDQSGEPWRLSIDIEAGDPVRVRDLSLELYGEAAGDEAFQSLLESPALAHGDVLHHGRFESMKRAVLSEGQRRGYLDGQLVESWAKVNGAAGVADIRLAYDSGNRYRFGEVHHDETLLSAEQIGSLQPFEPGDWFDQRQLQELQTGIQRTRYFSSVLVKPQVDQAVDGVVPVELALLPAPRHNFNLGLGFSTDTEERVSVTWRTPRVNASGHSQETRLELSPVNPSGRTNYQIPLSHPLNDLLVLGARLEDNEFGDLDSRQTELSVRRERRRDEWIWGYSGRGLNEDWELSNQRKTSDYLLAGFTLSHKRRKGSLVDPESGLSQFYSFEVAGEGFGSDINLLRSYANFAYAITPAPRHRMVGRVELGAVLLDGSDRDDLAPSLNFFAGGSNSLRGFSYQSIGHEVTVPTEDGGERNYVVGGDRLLTASLEYQRYVGQNWRIAAFGDYGDAFEEGDFNSNYSFGFGLHYLTPVGAMRVEMARSISEDDPEWKLHIAVGAEF